MHAGLHTFIKYALHNLELPLNVKVIEGMHDERTPVGVLSSSMSFITVNCA